MDRRKLSFCFSLIALMMLVGCEQAEDQAEEKVRYVKVEEYGTQIEQDIKDIQNKNSKKEYNTLKFRDTTFAEFPECSEVYTLLSEDRGVGVEESIDTIKQWLQEIGQGDLDLERELRDANGEEDIGVPCDESKEFPYNYVGVYEYLDQFPNGNYFFVNTIDCYWQMGSNGAYSVSDGVINRYMNGTKAAVDAYGINEEDIISESKIDADSDDAYELIDGKVRICDARDMAVQYFEEGTPFAPSDGITIDISKAQVFQIKDKYGYIFDVSRSYKGIPIAYSDATAREQYDDVTISEDCKLAYVATSSTVNSFLGHNEAQPFTEEEKSDEIISLKSSVACLDQELASNLTVFVDSVELVYCPIRISEEDEQNELFPCWQYVGRNIANAKGIRIYHNALTGEIYLYEFDSSE